MTYESAIRRDRDAWREEMPVRCMCCDKPGWHYSFLHVHEIERRSQAPGRWGLRANYLKLCPLCHEKMGSAEWPHARQLALKQLRDPENYDLNGWLNIRGGLKDGNSRGITQKDVDSFLQEMQ